MKGSRHCLGLGLGVRWGSAMRFWLYSWTLWLWAIAMERGLNTPGLMCCTRNDSTPVVCLPTAAVMRGDVQPQGN